MLCEPHTAEHLDGKLSQWPPSEAEMDAELPAIVMKEKKHVPWQWQRRPEGVQELLPVADELLTPSDVRDMDIEQLARIEQLPVAIRTPTGSPRFRRSDIEQLLG